MKKIVFTIERQYGSGGRTVGKMLAENLGIHYYNKELVKLAAEESGISEELFVQADESLRSDRARFSFRRNPKTVYDGQLFTPDSGDFTSSENLFNYQAKIIRHLAETEPCVIVGRCADFVLKDYDNVVSCFVHAPMPFLLEQAAEKQPMRGEELQRFIEKTDRHKAAYYEYYTGQTWNDANNYDNIYQSDLCGWVGKMGYDSEQIYGANVYKANGAEELAAAAFYATGPNTEYEIYVVHDFENEVSFSEREKAASGVVKCAGYYTVDFDETFDLQPGERYAVMVRLKTPGAKHPMAIEYDTGDKILEGVNLDDGEGYISLNGKKFMNVKDKKDCNLCIKAFTRNKEWTKEY